MLLFPSPVAPRLYSERRLSDTSISSVDTLQGLSLAFEQTIALGQEALDSELWLQGLDSDYTTDMARFVASEMTRLSATSPAEGSDRSSNNTSLSLPDTSETASSTGSVIYINAPYPSQRHARVGSRDSQTSSVGSLGQPDDSSSWDGSGGSASGQTGFGFGYAFASSAEIPAPVETVPPPPEFRTNEEEEEEEMVTVTEEYIVPIGPLGLDYSAALRVSREEMSTRSGSGGGVVKAVPMSVLNRGADLKPPPLEQKPPKADVKEEFVLTVEDLSSVSLLPDRPSVYKQPKPRVTVVPLKFKPQFEPEAPSASLNDPGRARMHLAYVSDHGHAHPVLPADDRYHPSPHATREPTSASLYLPSMRYTGVTEPLPFSDDDRSSVSSTDHVYRSTAMVTVSSSGSAHDDTSDAGSDRTGGTDSRRMSDAGASSTPPPRLPALEAQRELQHQYNEMQDQLSVWQRQLERNQALLAAQNELDGNEHDDRGIGDDQRLSIESQMAQGLQMLESVRQSMQALQLKQHSGLRGGAVPSPPPPPPPPAAEPAVAKSARAGGTAQTAAMSKARPLSSRFEPQLDPREELMIAIRSFGGRTGLNAAAGKSTRWVNRN